MDQTGDNECSGKLVWLITGTSSGIGKALVHAVLAHGDYVIATARNVDTIRHFTDDPKISSRVIVRSLDVTAPFAKIRSLAGEVVQKWGRIDVLVNNAGVGMFGIAEEVGVEGYKAQFETNFFGPMNVTNAFLPYMRAQRKGTIVFMGSRSCWRANIPMLGTYAASKAALVAMAEGLSVEVAPMGIKVLNILLGSVRTGNWKKAALLPTSADALSSPLVAQSNTKEPQADSTKSGNTPMPAKSLMDGDAEDEAGKHIADYTEMRKRQIEWMRNATWDGDASKCARAIVDVVGGEKNWPELNLLVLGADAEANIRDKCHAILKNLDEWKDVTRGISLDSGQIDK